MGEWARLRKGKFGGGGKVASRDKDAATRGSSGGGGCGGGVVLGSNAEDFSFADAYTRDGFVMMGNANALYGHSAAAKKTEREEKATLNPVVFQPPSSEDWI